MSTQALKNETINAPELTAEPKRQTATETYPVTVTLDGKFGRAFISWELRGDAAIGNHDAVQLREGSKIVFNKQVTGTKGEFDTNCTWGTGLTASYWSQNTRDSKQTWRQLVVTSET